MSACGSGYGAVTARRVGGRVRPGVFVSPFSYEHFVRGELAIAHGNFVGAAEELRLARAGPEDDPFVIARLADVTDRLGNEREAFALLDQGEALDGDSEAIWMTRGRIHERHGRAEPAIAAFGRASAAAPSSDVPAIALAHRLRAVGHTQEAAAVLERYAERGDSAGVARARLEMAIELGRPEAAAAAVRALLEVAPARADEVRAAVRMMLAADRPELALRLSNALASPAREDLTLALHAAVASGARDRAERILAGWMPADATALTTVAEGYLAIGLVERAAEVARVAIASGGGPHARLILGRSLARAGELAEAGRVLAEIGPDDEAWPDAPIELARLLEDAGVTSLAVEVLAHAAERRASPALETALTRTRSALTANPDRTDR